MKKLAAPLAMVMLAGFMVPAHAQESATAVGQCQNPAVEIVDGSLNWGVKESYRKYIRGRIAAGSWETSGAVTTNGATPTSSDFQFIFEVDPATSTLDVDADGNITAAQIETKDSTIVFEGHHGALYSEMHSPYIVQKGDEVQTGVSYVSYFVPGKEMVQYTPEDRTEANKVTGKDTFAQGSTTGWDVNDGTATLSGTSIRYVAKPGTTYDSNTGESKVEGIDMLFMGMYNDDYQPEIDDFQVKLDVRTVCKDATSEAGSQDASTAESSSQTEQAAVTTSEEQAPAATKEEAAPAASEEATKESAAESTTNESKPAQTSTAKPSATASANVGPFRLSLSWQLSLQFSGLGFLGLLFKLLSALRLF